MRAETWFAVALHEVTELDASVSLGLARLKSDLPALQRNAPEIAAIRPIRSELIEDSFVIWR